MFVLFYLPLLSVIFRMFHRLVSQNKNDKKPTVDAMVALPVGMNSRVWYVMVLCIVGSLLIKTDNDPKIRDKFLASHNDHQPCTTIKKASEKTRNI